MVLFGTGLAQICYICCVSGKCYDWTFIYNYIVKNVVFPKRIVQVTLMDIEDFAEIIKI